MDICLSREPTLSALKCLFADQGPIEIVEHWDSAAFKPGSHSVQMRRNHSEFPVALAFAHSCVDPEAWLLEAARRLSVVLDCRTLYTGSPLANARPYHCIVFDSGVAYLADDSESRVVGDGDGAVKLMRRLPQLDAGSEDFSHDTQ